MSAENMGDQDGYQSNTSNNEDNFDCKIPIVLNPQDSNLPLQLEEKKSNRIKNLGEKEKDLGSRDKVVTLSENQKDVDLKMSC